MSAPEISPPLTASVVASTDAGPSEGRTSGAFGQATPPPPDLRTRIKDAALALVRDPNPILLKELRATLRTPLFVRFLYLCTGLVAIVVLMGSATFSGTNTAPAEVGRAIFHLFFGTLALVLVFAAPSQAASAFTLEKETKTWESLLLSGMSPTRIVLGKFFAVYGSILLVVIAVAPVIGVGFLFGGVSPLAVLVGFGWLLGALAVAVSFGIAVSVRMESTRSSVSATTVSGPVIGTVSGPFETRNSRTNGSITTSSRSRIGCDLILWPRKYVPLPLPVSSIARSPRSNTINA